MTRLAAFTGGHNVPSARFRLRQYIPQLQRYGIEVRELPSILGSYPPPSRWSRPFWAVGNLTTRLPQVVASHSYDAVFLQREMLSSLYTLEPLTGRPRILDVDDAIFLHRDGQFARRLARSADRIICGNTWLANWFAEWNARIDVIATAIDTRLYSPEVAHSPPSRVPVIGWIGTASNHRYLQTIEAALTRVMAAHDSVRLLVVSDARPPLGQVPVERVDFVRWAQDIEVDAIRSMDIGIMPLDDSPWARGKCSFKMLQYLSCAIPAVVSPVGMNRDVLSLGKLGLPAATQDQWVQCLMDLVVDPALRAALGHEGRRAVEANYSLDVIAPQLANSIHSALL